MTFRNCETEAEYVVLYIAFLEILSGLYMLILFPFAVME